MDTQGSNEVSTKLVRIAQMARKYSGQALTTLAHHIDLPFLRAAHERVRKDGAPGVDGQTAEQYSADLEANLQDLLERFKSGRYCAPAVRRAHIPKGDKGRTRPIGIPTFEDKILQKAVQMVLEPIYEEDFLDCSYGYRPGRSAHEALEDMWRALMNVNGGWVLDVDLAGFFDSLDRGHLRNFLDKRVRDGVLRRSIDKWLKAGVMEEGNLHHPEHGTPQGSVISPLLSNIYLHEVIDVWFVQEVRPRLRGTAYLFRFADDLVIVCAREDDARRVMEVLPKRLGRFGLELNMDKTAMVDFRRPSYKPGQRPEGVAKPGTFTFLGFTHYWGRSRKGRWTVKRKTAKDRFNRTVKRIADWCRCHRHLSLDEQQQALNRKLRGHDAYFGITGNYLSLIKLRWLVSKIWHKWLARRCHRGRMTWERFNLILERYPLVQPRVVRSVFRQA